MEAATDWLLQTLNHPSPDSLFTVQSRHRSRDDDFNLPEVFSFMPEHFHPTFAERLRLIIAPSISFYKEQALKLLGENTPPSDSAIAAHLPAAQATVELVWLFVHTRHAVPGGPIFGLICDLHDIMFAVPDAKVRNQISKICEWFWGTKDPRREHIVPQTLLFLLYRSFGGEGVAKDHSNIARGRPPDVTRVYNMRHALDCVELVEGDSDATTARNLLLRCTTSSLYIQSDHGRKFLAHLLTVDDIRDSTFQSLMNQLAVARKNRATNYGDIILYAWRLSKSEWFFSRLRDLAEKAIFAATEPLGTNLRTVLSSFHKSKRDLTVDKLLHQLYAPILYKNLMVANPRVRRNAVTILAESFPIHDPRSLVQEIAEAIDNQCSKMVELLVDPAPVVRKATVEGTCRVLCVLWELVPIAFASKMLDIITTKLAFDASAQVRIAVFDGLKSLVNNHLTHQTLSISLPRLGPLINDSMEKVRLAFLDLLVAVKSKRIRAVRYFDVVSLDDLLTRLPIDSPAVSTKIMSLVVSSYFPLERVGKTAEQISKSQVRACLSMLRSNRDASEYFYQNLNLHVPPGPLCEFAMRISTIALEAPDETIENPSSAPTAKGKRPKRRTRSRPFDENDPPFDKNSEDVPHTDNDQEHAEIAQGRARLLRIVSDILTSISPSLQKPTNRSLRRYVDGVFGGEGLLSLLDERRNSTLVRATSWRIASCISLSSIQPVAAFWQKQLDTVLDWPRFHEREVQDFESLLSALVLCGFRWNSLQPLCSAVSKWADSSKVSALSKKRRKGRTNSKQKKPSSRSRRSSESHCTEMQMSALFALRTLAVILTREKDVSEEFRVSLLESKKSDRNGQDSNSLSVRMIRSIRKGFLTAIDKQLENHSDEDEKDDTSHLQALLDGISVLWQFLLSSLASTPSQKTLSTELREVLQWTAGLELITSAMRVCGKFARSLAIMSIQFLADSATVELLGGADMPLVLKIASNIAAAVDWSEQIETLVAVAELVRLSFQLKQQHSHITNDCEHENLPKATSSASASLMVTAFDILTSCKMTSDLTNSNEANTLARFLGDLLVAFSYDEDEIETLSPVGERLTSCFATMEKAQTDVLARVIYKIIVDLVISPSKNERRDPNRIYAFLVSRMNQDPKDGYSQYACANFKLVVVTSISSALEDSDAAPNDVMRQFLAHVDVDVGRSEEGKAEELKNDSILSERISKIRSTLEHLRRTCCPTLEEPS